MAISNDTVGLIFKLQADSSQAKQEFAKFDADTKKAMSGLTDNVRKFGKESNSIVRESVESISSEIIESFGVDGDVANMLANQLVVLRNSTLILAGGITAALALIGAGMVAAANKAAELGNKIGDLQKVTGLTAETLSGLNLAARQEGKTLDDLSGALVTFNKNLIEAQRGSKEFQGIFRQLGVDFRGDTDQALKQAIDRISGMKDGALKAAAASKVFGDNVTEVVLILANLEGGIDKAIEKARELGLFFDEEGVRSAAAYENQIRSLEIQYDALSTRIGKQVIPALTGLVSVMDQSLSTIGKLISGTDSLGQALLKLASLGILTFMPGGLGALGTAIAGETKTGTTTPPFKPARIGGGAKKKEEELKEFTDLAGDIAKLQARLRKEELDRELTLLKIREQAEEAHQRRMEQLDQAAAERTIAIIEREAQQRVITEEQAAEQIGAIRIAAFANRELQLKAEIESLRNRLAGISEEEVRAELLAEEQKFLDELEILQERRAAIEEEAVNRVIDARRRDLENLIQTATEMRRIRAEQLENQGFTPAVADAIAGMEVLLGRTLTLWERNRIAAQEYA